ncbi:hypothetical protein VP01_4257g1 [Puccinia sorghi]|uniref:Uncharacterized protein n=1 Tax=Puccinia sorghi TaxID=27349 RepID=A0A0L6USC3_9BASI|nr:hypothetical protein VP01_4257g1 [Puccinia sorghi]
MQLSNLRKWKEGPLLGRSSLSGCQGCNLPGYNTNAGSRASTGQRGALQPERGRHPTYAVHTVQESSACPCCFINSIILRDINSQNSSWTFCIMRHSFIYSVLHLSTFAFFTAATPPGWNQAQSKTCLPFDLNLLPAEEIPPESLSSSDVQIASSPAMEKLIAPSGFTSEELAVNNHVFPGLRGLPSADVDSASSHGCDHRGYPLAQQSSSNRFSSTSAGKRKTSDSSSGSTSKRYKKGDTSDRYEPHNVINQHFSLETSVSDVSPTSSKPGYVLPTEKNPTTDEIGELQKEEVAVRTGLETNKETGMLFNVYDWNFLREFPESEMADDHQHQFLRYLNQCKGASDVESFFFIQKDQAKHFLTTFASRKRHWKFKYPSGMKRGVRLGMLFETLLSLSEKKINLEGYPFFKNEIIDGMRQRLITNYKTTQNPSSTPGEETLLRFVRDITKVTQLLIVAQLSLFKEHKQEVLTVGDVEKHLEFLQEFWLQLDEGTLDMQQRDWAQKVHCLFRFHPHQNTVYTRSFTKNEKKYHFCWYLVNYWRERTGRTLGGYSGKRKFPTSLQELVNKIILYSNYHP